MITRLVSFFILSLSLHAAALVYPVSFGGRSQTEIIQVKILPMEQEGGGAGGQGGNGISSSPAASKAFGRAPRIFQPEIDSKPTSDPEPQVLSTAAPLKFSESSAALVAAISNSAEINGTAILGSLGDHVNGSSAGRIGIGGNGNGLSGTGSGQGLSGNGAALIQARYSETPKPVYPESARRQGREGRVLVRVLVDDQGRTKSLEINSSSGSDALDRAAAEAIKQWRFHPARYGDKAVESWLRIPIEFRLADVKSW